jgi:hypothetical protein
MATFPDGRQTPVLAKDARLPARSVAVLGQPSSIRPGLTGIALAIEACPIEEDLTILTDSLSAMRLIQSMQRISTVAQTR